MSAGLQCTRPYLEGVLPRPAAKSAAAALLAKCDSTERSDSSSDDEEGQDLCNCEFSLAYGAHAQQLCMDIGLDFGVLSASTGRVRMAIARMWCEPGAPAVLNPASSTLAQAARSC